METLSVWQFIFLHKISFKLYVRKTNIKEFKASLLTTSFHKFDCSSCGNDFNQKWASLLNSIIISLKYNFVLCSRHQIGCHKNTSQNFSKRKKRFILKYFEISLCWYLLYITLVAFNKIFFFNHKKVVILQV